MFNSLAAKALENVEIVEARNVEVAKVELFSSIIRRVQVHIAVGWSCFYCVWFCLGFVRLGKLYCL